MRKLKERVAGLFRRSSPEDRRGGLRARWLRTCLLPSAVATAVGVALPGGYLAFSVPERTAEVVISACVLWAAVMLVLYIAGGRYVCGVTEQLGRLKSQTRRMTEGVYGVLTEKQRDDELGDLTDSINELDGEISRSKAVQSEFISSVSHELRTPLTAIMGWAEALAFDDAIKGDSRRGIAIISKESGRLTKMVSELLEFTRIQDGRFNLNLETVDLAAEVEDAVFTYRSLMEQEGVQLCYTCDEETIPMIEGDPERLKQVFLNILDNAVKYGRDGETVEVSVVPEDGSVLVRVRDHGSGIPKDELPHVKERFYKGSSRERGSGIGLAVCEEIVTRHGGTLLIENATDGGVLVTICLPERQ